MNKLIVILLFTLLTVVSCAKKKQVGIESPDQEAPPVTTEPQTPPTVPPPEQPKPPKKTLPPPAPRPRAVSPGDASALKLVESGVKQLNTGNLESAEQFFEQAIRVSPTNGRPYYYLGVVAVKQKNYDRAMGFLSQAQVHLHSDPFWMSQILLQEGLVLKAQNQKAAALQKFRESVSKDPSNSWAKRELDALAKQ